MTRHALLDDALIHLHYADMLPRYRFITFDGIHHSFGTSSLLYVSLRAILRGSPPALLPKVVSDLGFLMILKVLLSLPVKVQGRQLRQLFLAGLLAA